MKIKIEVAHEEAFVETSVEPMARPAHYRGRVWIRGEAVIEGEVCVFERRVEVHFHPAPEAWVD